MTDLELARENLGGHTLVLCRGGELMISDARGVSPMMDYIAEGRDLHGFSAADVIVGKATAMLFVKAGITAVYAGVVSAAGKKYLEEHGVPLTFGSVTERTSLYLRHAHARHHQPGGDRPLPDGKSRRRYRRLRGRLYTAEKAALGAQKSGQIK